jgi:hypothetical protein
MKNLSLLIITAILTIGCAQSGYQKFYYPNVDVTTLTGVEFLKEGEEPKMFGTDDFERDGIILLSKKYAPVGYSSFNGGLEDTKNAIAQAKSLGATIVLVNSEYTNTQTTTSTLFLPNNQTTHHSGSISSKTSYTNTIGMSKTNSTYSGTSSTSGIQAVPITSNQRRYDQKALYFVKMTKERVELGIFVDTLTPSQRKDIGRNTGVYIVAVAEDTPAFYYNLFSGDVITAINGKIVLNKEHADKIMRDIYNNKETATLDIIRNGQEKRIKLPPNVPQQNQ